MSIVERSWPPEQMPQPEEWLSKHLLLVAIVASALVLALVFWVSSPAAQAPEPYAETNLLLVGCSFATASAEAEGLRVEWCRRESELVFGSKASLAFRVKIRDLGRFRFETSWINSPWWVSSLNVEQE